MNHFDLKIKVLTYPILPQQICLFRLYYLVDFKPADGYKSGNNAEQYFEHSHRLKLEHIAQKWNVQC